MPASAAFADWLRYAEREFRTARLSFGHGTDNPRDEAVWLLLHVAAHSYDDLQGAMRLVLSPAQQRRARDLIAARIATRKPLAHLLHEAWLGDRRFYVDERVIVPRSHIAELIEARMRPWIKSRVKDALDLCTGSGCLGILLALAFPGAKVDAVDVSSDALAVAKRNVRDYRLASRVSLVESDLYGSLAGRQYDLIVSNPPYVDARAMSRMPQEYRQEPRLALAGGADGLDLVRTILAEAPRHLKPRGVIVVEIGANRKALERAFPSLPFAWPALRAGGAYVFVLTREQLLGA